MFQIDASITPPARCFLCERSADPGEQMVDTTFQNNPDWSDRLSGEKLVCDTCAREVARASDLLVVFTATEWAEYERHHVKLRNRAQQLEDEASAVDKIKEIVANTLQHGTPTPPPAKKAPSKRSTTLGH